MRTSRSDLTLVPLAETPFLDNAAHVRAEIAWVHQLVRSHLRAECATGERRVDEFAGLCIPREEIEDYLASDEEPGERVELREDGPGALPRTEPWRGRSALDRRVQLSLDHGVDLRFTRIARAFDLDLQARAALSCAVAAEVDPRIARACAYLQNDASRRRPSLTLLAEMVTDRRGDPVGVRRLFGPASALASGRLLESWADSTPVPLRDAIPASGIVDYLLGVDALPTAIRGLTAMVMTPRALADAHGYYRHHAALVAQLSRSRAATGVLPVSYVSGPAGAGRRLVVEAFAAGLNRTVLRVSWRRMPGVSGIEDWGFILAREARIRQSVVHIEGFDDLPGGSDGDQASTASLQRLIEALSGVDVIATGAATPAAFRHRLGIRARGMSLPSPTAAERVEMWSRALPDCVLQQMNGDLHALAEKFRFTPGQIAAALCVTEMAAPRGPGGEPLVTVSDLHAGCREEALRGLHLHCDQIVPRFAWDDIVLPADVQAQLREICHWVKHGPLVYDAWGFGAKVAMGRGVSVLFSGPSGTGKTMSAEVIAADLQLDLFRVDLSRVISKYIGETERNLARIFEQSAVSHCVLFFDEADALFGKRTEVKDAHDRYANIEVNYLLSQMDRYHGLIIVATNLKGNLDPAFIRRFSHVVEYPVPNERLRESIWRKSFPPTTPLGADVDFEFLAQHLDLSGANIKNIALTSAFLAAEAAEIGMDHVIRATRREFQKLGRICSKSDFGQYYGLVRETDAS